MKILVIGANGKVGRIACKYLKQGGHQVIAMLRSEKQSIWFLEMGIETVIANLECDFSFAIKGIDIIVFTAGSGSKTGPDKTILIDREAAIRSMDYAKAFGVKQYIMISAQGVREPEKESPIQHYYQAKYAADAHLIKSGIEYTILRPGRLLDGLNARGYISSIDRLDRGETFRDDVAKMIVAVCGNKRYKNQIVEIVKEQESPFR